MAPLGNESTFAPQQPVQQVRLSFVPCAELLCAWQGLYMSWHTCSRTQVRRVRCGQIPIETLQSPAHVRVCVCVSVCCQCVRMCVCIVFLLGGAHVRVRVRVFAAKRSLLLCRLSG